MASTNRLSTTNFSHLEAGQDLASTSRVRTGRRGEDLATKYLLDLGWQVLHRNWRCPAGEIDITAIQPDPTFGSIAVAVEVKYRTGLGYGDPLEAITQEKLLRLRRLTAIWSKTLVQPVHQVRLDAIGILQLPGQAPQFRHLKGL